MKNRFGILGAFVAMIGTANAGPSVGELMAAPPNEVRGPYDNGAGVDPQKNYTAWHIESLFSGPGESRVCYKAEVEIWSLNPGGVDFLVLGGFFTRHTASSSNQSTYRPTQKFVDYTKPDDITGGTWEFGFRTFDDEFRPPAYAYQVASWTWTEDPIVIDPDPDPPVVVPSPIIRKNVEMGVNVGNAVSRAVRGKNERKALKLLNRQRRLLMWALVAE